MILARTEGRNKSWLVAMGLAALLAVLTLGLVKAQAASAAPPICDQYPSLPICEQGHHGGGNHHGNPAGGPAGLGGNGPTANQGSASGELPFTGYPLTPLILLLLALLVIGLTIRTYLYARDRYRTRHSTGPALL